MAQKYSIIIFLTLLCIIPRLGMLFSTYDYFLHEQGELYLITKGILVNHELPLISPEVGGVGNFAKGPFFSYFFLIPFIIFQGNPFGGRVLMFLISTGTVIGIYFLVKNMYGENVARIAAFLSSICPFFIVFAGNIFAPYVIPLLTIVYLFSLFHICLNKNQYLPLAAFTLSLMMHFEIVSGVTLGIPFSIVLLYSMFRGVVSRKIIATTILFFFIPLIPVLLYDLLHHFENINGIIAFLTYSSKKAEVIKTMTYHQIISNRIDTFSWSFLGSFTPQKVLAISILLIMVVTGVLYCFDKKITNGKKLFIVFLAVQPLITFSFLLFYKSVIFSWWIIELSIIYILLLAVFTDYLWKMRVARYGLVILYTLVFLAFLSRSVTLFKQNVRLSQTSYISQLEPLQYIFENSKSNSFYLEVHTNRPSTKDYEYLTWWLEKTRYKKTRIEPTISYVITEKGFPTFITLTKQAEKNTDIKHTGDSFVVQKISRQ